MIPQLQREEIVVTLHIDSFCAVGVGKHLDILPEGHWELFECVNNVQEKIYVVDKYLHQLGMEKGIITTLFNRTGTEKSPKK